MAVSPLSVDTLKSLESVPGSLDLCQSNVDSFYRLPSSLRLDSAFFLDLARKQTKIETLFCGPFSDAVSQSLQSPFCSASWPASTESLEIPPDIANVLDLEGATAFLEHLTSLLGERGSCLSSFTCDSPRRLGATTMDNLMRVCTGITMLQLAFPCADMANTNQVHTALLKNSEPLECLFLAVYRADRAHQVTMGVPPPDFMRTLSGRLGGLQQVALRSPLVPVSLSNGVLDNDYVDHLRHASAGAELRALRLLNWPGVPDSIFTYTLEHTHEDTVEGCGLYELTRWRYEALLDKFAKLVMQIIQSHRIGLGLFLLRAIGFGGPYQGSGAVAETIPATVIPEHPLYVLNHDRSVESDLRSSSRPGLRGMSY